MHEQGLQILGKGLEGIFNTLHFCDFLQNKLGTGILTTLQSLKNDKQEYGKVIKMEMANVLVRIMCAPNVDRIYDHLNQ